IDRASTRPSAAATAMRSSPDTGRVSARIASSAWSRSSRDSFNAGYSCACCTHRTASEPHGALRYHGGMTVLLAIDTSGALCSLAIHAAGRWFEHTHKVERLHNRVVLQDLERLTVQAGVRRNAFRAVAFGAGPGSFTGVRIAAAVAQAVAFASDGEVVPVRSSLALATAAG